LFDVILEESRRKKEEVKQQKRRSKTINGKSVGIRKASTQADYDSF